MNTICEICYCDACTNKNTCEFKPCENCDCPISNCKSYRPNEEKKKELMDLLEEYEYRKQR